MAAGYSLFVDLFRDFFAWRPEEDERERGERLAGSLRELVSCGELSAERAGEMGPLLGNLLSVRFDSDWDERLQNASPEQIQYQTFMAVREFLVVLSRVPSPLPPSEGAPTAQRLVHVPEGVVMTARPLLLVLEDLHWADSLSLDLISLLMESLALAPIGLLCVYRPEREQKCAHLATIAERKCPERFTEIHLRELTPDQSGQLVASLLQLDNLPGPVKALILEKSRGNPFFLEEMVRLLIDSRVIYRDEGVWKVREEIQRAMVPESVQSLILSRVDRLRPDLKRVLQSASVIGRVFRTRLLARMIGQESGLERALWELEDQGLVYQERAVPEEEYSFKHVLTQETIYQNILRRHRAGFHQRVAEVMEALYQGGLEAHYEGLAYHYERSADDEKAVEYLLKAGEKARRAYLNEEAIGYFQRALERLAASPLGEAHQDWRLEALRGIGQVYYSLGRLSEAEESFRQAIAAGRELQLRPRELVRLYYWLGYMLYWQGRAGDLLRIGEEGLALLAGDTESAEAAMMNSLLAADQDRDRFFEFTRRNVAFLERLPYSEELRVPYSHIAMMFAYEGNFEAAMKWLQILEQRAREHHDLRGVGEVHWRMAGEVSGMRGDIHAAAFHYQQGAQILGQIGDEKLRGRCLRGLAYTLLSLGRLKEAEESAVTSLQIMRWVGSPEDTIRSLMCVGRIAIAAGDYESALAPLEEAARLFPEADPRRAWVARYLGRASLALGQRQEASRQFEKAMRLSEADLGELAEALSGMEEVYDDPEGFRAFCRRFKVEHPVFGGVVLRQWFLEPVETEIRTPCQIRESFAGLLSADWVWNDPFRDCSFVLEQGLVLRAANERSLANGSAPRLLRPVSGLTALQAVNALAAPRVPAIGGLLLWKNKENLLRLERGTRGPYEVSFLGRMGGQDVIIGRGRLPAERIFLRLERRGGTIRALCSADGRSWFTVGQVEFPVASPLEVGLHAIGAIDRTIYPGAYPEGTAIRFESFELWA